MILDRGRVLLLQFIFKMTLPTYYNYSNCALAAFAAISATAELLLSDFDDENDDAFRFV